MLGSLNPKLEESLGPLLNQLRSSFEPVMAPQNARFHVFQNFQNFDSLVKYRSIWGEIPVNLNVLDHFVFQNLEFRNYTD